MNAEQRQITVTAYRDREGNPTCATNFETGEICIFYRTQRFGCLETCVFAEHVGKYSASLRRRKDGNGCLEPLEQCPIWKNETQT